MRNKLTTKDIFIFVLLIVFGVPTVVITYYYINQTRQQNKLKEVINSIPLNSSYRKVYSDCGDVELRQECTNGYYALGDSSQIESATIAGLKQQGYNFEKVPGGIDGPSPTYRTWRGDIEIIIYFRGGDNQAYKKSMGNVQIRAF